MKKLLGLIALLICCQGVVNKVQAQVNINDSVVSTFIIPISYAYHLPYGDIEGEFGSSSAIGTGLIYKTSANWIWMLEGNYIFGTKVKNTDAIISQLLTSTGGVVGTEGTYVELSSMQRGFDIMLKLGKLLPVFGINDNSGLFMQLGVGYLQHTIRWTVENNNAPQLQDDYKKGYDRLTEGVALSQELGLMVMSDKRMWNYKIALEAIEGFTQNKRYNFDLMRREPKHRVDVYLGFKFTWMIPLFGRAPKDMYYF